MGGLGQNRYLYNFLLRRLQTIKVVQPDFGFALLLKKPDINRVAAIMRGAVLHEIDRDFGIERIVRKSYGIILNPVFRPGHHPISRKVTCLDGTELCENVMHWFVRKVYSKTLDEKTYCRMTKLPTDTIRNAHFPDIFLLLNTKTRA